MGLWIVVKITDAGARYLEEDGTISISKTGHVWLTLVNDQTGEEFNFGFHPSIEGERKTDPGLVRVDDYRYIDIGYQRRLAISADQFNSIYNICQTARSQNTFGAYVGGWNACPDFAFKVLWQAGVGTNSLSVDGLSTIFKTPQRAALWPAANVPLLRGMANYNDKFVAPALSGSGLDARDTNNRIKVISNVLQDSTNTQSSISSNLSASIVVPGSPEAFYIETTDGGRNVTRTEVGPDKVEIAAKTLKPGETLVCIAGTGTTYWGIQQATGIPTTTLQTMNNTVPEKIQIGQRLVVAKSSTDPDSLTPNNSILDDLSQATFDQKWQYNFQTILGPANPAFIDATMNGQDIAYNYTLDYNPNGVLWRVNASGIPHPDDFDRYYEQQRIIESTTNRTIAEMYNGSDLSVSGRQGDNQDL